MDGHNDLRKATLDKGQNGLPSAGYGALSENDLGKRRTESALRLDAYDKTLAAIEERLLRIENSLVFRTVRLVGRILTDCISWFGTGLPISWHRRLSSH